MVLGVAAGAGRLAFQSQSQLSLETADSFEKAAETLSRLQKQLDFLAAVVLQNRALHLLTAGVGGGGYMHKPKRNLVKGSLHSVSYLVLSVSCSETGETGDAAVLCSGRWWRNLQYTLFSAHRKCVAIRNADITRNTFTFPSILYLTCIIY